MSCRYQDILQGDFFEDYFLLAYKSLTWMLWSKTKCGKVIQQHTSAIMVPHRFPGLWKLTTTWSTTSGNLELSSKHLNSSGRPKQMIQLPFVFKHYNRHLSGTQSHARLKRNGWSGQRAEEGSTNGWISFHPKEELVNHKSPRWFPSMSGRTSSFPPTAGESSTSWVNMSGINSFRLRIIGLT